MLRNKLAKLTNPSSYCHIKARNKIVSSTIFTKGEPKQHCPAYSCFEKRKNLSEICNGMTQVGFEPQPCQSHSSSTQFSLTTRLWHRNFMENMLFSLT